MYKYISHMDHFVMLLHHYCKFPLTLTALGKKASGTVHYLEFLVLCSTEENKTDLEQHECK